MLTTVFRSERLRIVAGVLCVGCFSLLSACATPGGSSMDRDPFLTAADAANRGKTHPTSTRVAKVIGLKKTNAATDDQFANETSHLGGVWANPTDTRLVDSTIASANMPGEADDVGTVTLAQAEVAQPTGVQVYSQDARVLLGMGGMFCPPCPGPIVCAQSCETRVYKDEYLCDGGDRGYPIHYDDYNRQGLETEDTIAEYVDSSGEFKVKASNRVCVYAPRFAAMRTIDTPVTDIGFAGIASADRSTRTGGLLANTGFHTQTQQTPVVGVNMRSRASGVDVPVGVDNLGQNANLGEYSRYRSGHQEIQFLAGGILKESEEAWLAKGIRAAKEWSQVQFPQITGRTQAAQEVHAEFKPEEMVGIEDEGQGELRIVKMADRQEALPGDIITFTLRYDNIGDGRLYHIRIVDNLTPRLELVEDSETSDRGGRIFYEDNSEGSLVLIFELDEVLPPKTGGVVTFQARVR